MHLTPNGCVAIRFKMLTYYMLAPLLNLIDALPLNAIYNFETASSAPIQLYGERQAGIGVPEVRLVSFFVVYKPI